MGADFDRSNTEPSSGAAASNEQRMVLLEYATGLPMGERKRDMKREGKRRSGRGARQRRRVRIKNWRGSREQRRSSRFACVARLCAVCRFFGVFLPLLFFFF